MAANSSTSVPPSAPTSRASQRALSLLVLLVLGSVVYYGFGSRRGSRPSERSNTEWIHPVDLNSTTAAELQQVPGVGPNMAEAILSHRRDRGDFDDVNELQAVHGVGGKTVEKLRPWFAIHTDRDSHLSSPSPDADILERKPKPKPPIPQYVGTPKIQPGDARIDVNSASETDLLRLPGVGPTLARRIVITRGVARFQHPEDLRRVKGIGVKTMDKIRDYVICGNP